MPDALTGLLGLAVVIAAAVGLWKWAHRDDDVWIDDDGCGSYYYEEWGEWYEEER
ncbi:hypothetical protein [Plantactinospora endophytica]|uniref:Uncharacterized protein n=1 Tax=Plantactinospora endophytica TaxID=673535 RepID=A0ABQ4EEK7_9ACTN|nr:hypothetical protein [Plantactinospora endophytica]GIG93150.1 hypothetical protein Pen02_80860 [Plantactinospora endophytica]